LNDQPAQIHRAHRRRGGRDRAEAVKFAMFENGNRPQAVIMVPGILELDMSVGWVVVIQQTRTIPIIFANVSDPVEGGFVASFSRPGGNVTGFVNFEGSVSGKWLGFGGQIWGN
jgi:ABC transporter substrate binding protein